MRLQTISLSLSKPLVHKGYPVLDVTVKSGDKTFAPTWDLLMRYKNGVIDKDRYTAEFTTLMRESYRINPNRWHEVCRVDSLIIACYCRAGIFCHRHLLKDMFKLVCQRQSLPFEYLGEIDNVEEYKNKEK